MGSSLEGPATSCSALGTATPPSRHPAPPAHLVRRLQLAAGREQQLCHLGGHVQAQDVGLVGDLALHLRQ